MSIKDELTRLTGVPGKSIGDVLDSVDSMGGEKFIIRAIDSTTYEQVDHEKLVAAISKNIPIMIQLNATTYAMAFRCTYMPTSDNRAIIDYIHQNGATGFTMRKLGIGASGNVTYTASTIPINLNP